MSERAQTLLATALLALNLLGWWWDRRRWRRLVEEAEDRVIDAVVASRAPLTETLDADADKRRAAREVAR